MFFLIFFTLSFLLFFTNSLSLSLSLSKTQAHILFNVAMVEDEIEVEVGCALGCEREVVGDMWVAIGTRIVMARAHSSNVESGSGCAAIRVRGEWVLIEVGGFGNFLGLVDC
jgi:hypothetical protein